MSIEARNVAVRARKDWPEALAIRQRPRNQKSKTCPGILNLKGFLRKCLCLPQPQGIPAQIFVPWSNMMLPPPPPPPPTHSSGLKALYFRCFSEVYVPQDREKLLAQTLGLSVRDSSSVFAPSVAWRHRSPEVSGCTKMARKVASKKGFQGQGFPRRHRLPNRTHPKDRHRLDFATSDLKPLDLALPLVPPSFTDLRPVRAAWPQADPLFGVPWRVGTRRLFAQNTDAFPHKAQMSA